MRAPRPAWRAPLPWAPARRGPSQALVRTPPPCPASSRPEPGRRLAFATSVLGYRALRPLQPPPSTSGALRAGWAGGPVGPAFPFPRDLLLEVSPQRALPHASPTPVQLCPLQTFSQGCKSPSAMHGASKRPQTQLCSVGTAPPALRWLPHLLGIFPAACLGRGPSTRDKGAGLPPGCRVAQNQSPSTNARRPLLGPVNLLSGCPVLVTWINKNIGAGRWKWKRFPFSHLGSRSSSHHGKPLISARCAATRVALVAQRPGRGLVLGPLPSLLPTCVSRPTAPR